jgi:hypothetical protein
VRLYGGEEELDPNLEAFLEAQEEEQAVLRALEEGPKPATKGGKKQVLDPASVQRRGTVRRELGF